MRVLRIASLLVTFTGVAAAQGQAGPVRTSAPPKGPDDPIHAEGYIKPPESVAKLVAAPRSSNWTWGAPSPTRKYLLHPYTEEPTLEFLGKRHYNLGGWQIDPGANRSRAMTYRNTSGYELLDWAVNKVIKVQLPPNSRGSTFTSWSPDGMTFAYFALLPDATQIYLTNPATGVSTPLTTKAGVIATNVENFAWTADGKSIVAVLVPDIRGPEPKDPTIAQNIRVRVNENNLLKTRNFPDLLDGPYEQDLFEYYNMGQLAIIDVKTKAITKVGAPGPVTRLEPSPDAKYFRVTYIDRPFSYVLPVANFGTHEVIIDGTGKVLKEMVRRPLREGTATDVVDPNDPNAQQAGGFGGRGGAGAADTTRRSLMWHPFESGLTFFRSASEDSATKRNREITDSTAAAARAANGRGGNGRGGRAGGGGRGGRAGGAGAADSARARPDTMFLWTAPFVGANSTILKALYVTPGNGTINGVQYSNDGKIMFVNETVNGQTKTDAIFLAENNARFTVTRGGGGGGAPAGRGGGGGRGGRGGGGGGAGVGLLTKEGSRGQTVVMQSTDGKFVYASAAGDSANADSASALGGRAGGGRGGRGGRGGAAGPRNGIDKIDIKTGARTRVYESTITDMTEGGVTPLNDDFTKAIATRQTSQLPPESFLIDVATKNATQLTTSKNYWPEITSAIHKTVFAWRADGVNLRIRVTLPADWKPGNKMPALFWFYPSEFETDSAYRASLTGGRGGAGAPPDSAVGGAGNFPAMGQRTMAFITAAGYALVENDAPIIATPGKLPNDNYVTDLQWDLEAAVNALADSGFVDRNKLAIGGHSYGAFSTMNALTHTTLFKAGIAGDGMYNRTLTPDGFQNERRDLWTGQGTYLAMSPMLYADKLQGAILMYHSEEDQNVGTDPISSIRMYQALMANGKTGALYMYPYEDHGPVARETNLDQWARWIAWLDKYVKNPSPEKPKAQ